VFVCVNAQLTHILHQECDSCGHKTEGSFAACTCPLPEIPSCAKCGQAEANCTCPECSNCGLKTDGSFAACACPSMSAMGSKTGEENNRRLRGAGTGT